MGTGWVDEAACVRGAEAAAWAEAGNGPGGGGGAGGNGAAGPGGEAGSGLSAGPAGPGPDGERDSPPDWSPALCKEASSQPR